MKIETEKIILTSLNLDQVQIAGKIISSRIKNEFQIQALHIEYSKLMQRNFSIKEIAEHFLAKGQLVSFRELKKLISFLVEEKYLTSPSIVGYFSNKTLM